MFFENGCQKSIYKRFSTFGYIPLTTLQELDLSFNRIESLEGIENLSNLEYLSLENNPRLKISDIDFVSNSISTTSRKSKKSMGSRPVPAVVMTELSKYVSKMDIGQEKLFNKNFNYMRWKRICEDAGLADVKFHDLRKTFGSVLAQRGVSTAVTQRLLEHSSPTLTNKVYTNVDPVLRQSINQLPVLDWL